MFVNQSKYHFNHSPSFLLVLSFTNNQGNFKDSISRPYLADPKYISAFESVNNKSVRQFIKIARRGWGRAISL